MQHFDYIWIGTGQGTGTAVPKLAQSGLKIAVVERDRFGGSCVNYGCTPTKALVASARAAHMIQRSGDFGIRVDSFEVDFPAVMERMNSIRNTSRDGLESWLKGMDNVEVFRGSAVFTGEHTVQIGRETIKGDRIVIHTGTAARKISVPGIEEIPWMDSGRLLDMEVLPEHLIVIGGSYIGLEFSQIFRRLGSRVTIIEASNQIMFREDSDIASVTREVFLREGIEILENSKIDSLEKTDQGVRVRLADGTVAVDGSHLLIGAGRVPATADLNLEAAGVKTDKRGFINVNDGLQTNKQHIYALGDVNGRGAFTHTSVNDAEIFLDRVLGNGNRGVNDRHVIYAMYTDPPLGRIGMSEKDAIASGRKVKMGTMPMAAISRAKEKGETDGLVKIIVDADTQEFLGATILGVGGDEIINMFAPPIYTGMPYMEFRKTVLAHPTVAELMPWILDGLHDFADSE